MKPTMALQGGFVIFDMPPHFGPLRVKPEHIVATRLVSNAAIYRIKGCDAAFHASLTIEAGGQTYRIPCETKEDARILDDELHQMLAAHRKASASAIDPTNGMATERG